MSYSHQLPGERTVGVIPRFYLDKVQNNFRSEQEGRAVFDDVEFVEIIVPGDSRSIVQERVKAEHKERWPNAYSAFKKGLEPATDGYPIEQWPPMTSAQVANYKAMHISTVEQLAELSDGVLMNLGLGGRQIRERAKAWLDERAGGQALERAMAEAERATAERADLERQIADLKSAVQTLQAKVAP